MTRESKTKYIILGLLSHEPLTGYDIRQHVERGGVSTFWAEISYGQIYPTLERLEKEGLVIKNVDRKEQRRLRKVYSITPKGREALRTWLEAPVEKEIFKLEILLKLYFGAQTSRETTIRHINEFKERNKQFLKLLNAFEESLRQVLDEKEDHQYFLLTLLYGKAITRAQLRWAEKALQQLHG